MTLELPDATILSVVVSRALRTPPKRTPIPDVSLTDQESAGNENGGADHTILSPRSRSLNAEASARFFDRRGLHAVDRGDRHGGPNHLAVVAGNGAVR